MNELKPYIVTVVEKYSRSVVVWAEDQYEAENAAYNLCNDGNIDISYDDFDCRDCLGNGVCTEAQLDFYEQYGKD